MRVAVLGAGIMGNGIAQVAAMAGHDVRVRDLTDEYLARGRATIDSSLARFVKSERLTQEQADATRGRLTFLTDLERAVADAEVVIEAVPEVLSLKQDGFRAVADAAPAEAYGERFRPPTLLKNMVTANMLGRKTGRGFYRYGPDGKRLTD